MTTKKETRRSFLCKTGLLGMAGIAGTGCKLPDSRISASRKFEVLKFGLIADIHFGLVYDADRRLDAFLQKVEIEKPDFVISLGDFVHNSRLPESKNFAGRFKSAACPAFHVLGNHDVDSATKKEACAFMEMSAPYYSCDAGGYHCVMLDGNYFYSDNRFGSYEKGNHSQYGDYINDEQCEWLVADLKATNLPVFIFSHQSLLHDEWGIPNKAYVQRLLEQENERAGFNKVLACFNGHHHQDFYRNINGIHYFSINSVSYFWHDRKMPGRYPAELQEKYKWMDNMAIYKDPLFCFVTIKPSGSLQLKGTESEWIAAVPDEIASKSVRFGREMTPSILDREVILR
ncbi:MAG: metallophosphoesterase [Tannerella sp.]|jgi:3',5'-cyclic AMP phosphodiesterase CpdA|nr:metallophosphoesterase [Tannerella sp.]